MVALAFLGPCPPRKQVNHKNGRKSDNSPENLEYLTAAENTRHARRLGLLARGERCGAAKLTADEVREMRRRYQEEDVFQSTLAEEYGISGSTASSILRGERWTHV